MSLCCGARWPLAQSTGQGALCCKQGGMSLAELAPHLLELIVEGMGGVLQDSIRLPTPPPTLLVQPPPDRPAGAPATELAFLTSLFSLLASLQPVGRLTAIIKSIKQTGKYISQEKVWLSCATDVACVDNRVYISI